MVFAYERDVAKAARKLDLPVVKSACTADGITERQKVKDLLNKLEKESLDFLFLLNL